MFREKGKPEETGKPGKMENGKNKTHVESMENPGKQEKQEGQRKRERKPRTGKWHYGSVSALLALILVLSLIVLNFAAQALEKKHGWQVDLSFNRISTHSEITREVLDQLEHPVQLWALFRKGDEDAPLLELLDRYAAESDKVTWQQMDPGLNPALIARFTTETETPGENSLIVFCEDTGRWRTLGPEDYVSLGMDMETGEYTYAGWTYERAITNAIAYVSRETVPSVVILQGHGELDGDSTASFAGLLQANRYEVRYEDLTDPAYVPDPGDLLVFFSPMRDLNAEELEKVNTFATAGGSFLFTCDYEDPIGNMPNYEALLRSYGFLPLKGIIAADESASGTYYNGNILYLIPNVCSTDLTLDLLGSGADTFLLPGARGFMMPEETDRNLTVSTVLQSGETAYRKELTGETVTMEKKAGDEEGPFALALQARRITTGGALSRAFIVGCSAAWTNRQIYNMTDTQQLIIRTMEFLLDTEASNLEIMAKEAVRPSLGIGSLTPGSVLTAALPMLVLLAALLVLGYRRRRG